MNKNGYLIVGLAVGSGIGYFVATYIQRKKYQEQIDLEISEIKAYYNTRIKEETAKLYDDGSSDFPVTTEEDIQNAAALIEAEGYSEDDGSDEDLENKQDVLTPDEAERFNYSAISKEKEKRPVDTVKKAKRDRNIMSDLVEADFASRSESEPYIITFEEFQANDEGFEQISLTYYDGDDTLVDDHQDPIPDVINTIGVAATTSFGRGSNDANTVYVRNHKYSTDYEVVLDKRHYTEHVLGIRTATRKNTRMNVDDD